MGATRQALPGVDGGLDATAGCRQQAAGGDVGDVRTYADQPHVQARARLLCNCLVACSCCAALLALTACSLYSIHSMPGNTPGHDSTLGHLLIARVYRRPRTAARSTVVLARHLMARLLTFVTMLMAVVVRLLAAAASRSRAGPSTTT